MYQHAHAELVVIDLAQKSVASTGVIAPIRQTWLESLLARVLRRRILV